MSFLVDWVIFRFRVYFPKADKKKHLSYFSETQLGEMMFSRVFSWKNWIKQMNKENNARILGPLDLSIQFRHMATVNMLGHLHL